MTSTQQTSRVGRVVILNGAPRSGKSSIVTAMQAMSDEPWMNVVVDVGHHDNYSTSLGVLPTIARRLVDVPTLLVGVRCKCAQAVFDRLASGVPFAAVGRLAAFATGPRPR